MPSTHKKVIVRKIDRDTVNGHVAPANFVRDGKLELLNTSGNVVAIDLVVLLRHRTVLKCGSDWVPRRFRGVGNRVADAGRGASLQAVEAPLQKA